MKKLLLPFVLAFVLATPCLADLVNTGQGATTNSNVKITDGTNTLGTSAHPVKVDPTGTTTQPITQQAATPVSGTLQSAVSASGNGSTLNVYGYETAVFTVSGTFNATVTFQGSSDGVNYTNLNATQLGTSTISTSTTSTGLYQVALGGCIKYIQAPITWTSGTSVTVTAVAAMGSWAPRTVTSNAGSGNFNNASIGTNLTTAPTSTSSSGSVYNVSPPAPSNGQIIQDQADSQGNKKVYLASAIAGEDITNNVLGTINKVVIASTYSPSSYHSVSSGSQVAQANIKSTAGVLSSLSFCNSNASTKYYLWITNATTSPANALASSDSSVICIYTILPSQARDIPIPGKYFSTGISFGLSTSATSFTAGTAADLTLDVFYY